MTAPATSGKPVYGNPFDGDDTPPPPEKLRELLHQLWYGSYESIRRLRRVEDQVKRTNGRVSDLEKWRDRAIGAIAVLVIMIVPLFLEILKSK